MKKLLVTAFCLLLMTTVIAQDEQETKSSGSGDSPTMWLGGEVTFGAMSNRDFTFGPSVMSSL